MSYLYRRVDGGMTARRASRSRALDASQRWELVDDGEPAESDALDREEQPGEEPVDEGKPDEEPDWDDLGGDDSDEAADAADKKEEK